MIETKAAVPTMDPPANVTNNRLPHILHHTEQNQVVPVFNRGLCCSDQYIALLDKILIRHHYIFIRDIPIGAYILSLLDEIIENSKT